MHYKIGITTYDDDQQLWETHIGFNMELCYSTWGATEVESRNEAHLLLATLHNFRPKGMWGRTVTDSEPISEP